MLWNVCATGTGEYSDSRGSRQLQISYCAVRVLQDNEIKSQYSISVK